MNKSMGIVGGAGHVGLPLGLVFASRGWDVTLYDINASVLETIGSGQLPFREHGAEPYLQEALAAKRLHLTTDPAALASVEVIVITIGTPIDEFYNPTMKALRECLDELLPHIHEGQTLILRSTVYPGTTEWLAALLAEHGKNVHLCFCPERIVQGYAIDELQRLPQIISGVGSEAEERVAKIFEDVAPELVRLTPLEAEFAKLFTNSYRYIQFAIANQFYMIANSAGVDYSRILAGLKQDYPRSRDMPGAGFAAGPCLFKDTVQLAAFAENNFTLGHAAMLINEGLVLYIVDRLARKYQLPQMTVGLLGMSFKADSDDIRSSLSYKLKKMLQFRAGRVLTSDPFVTNDAELLPLDEVIERSDLLILSAPHSVYRQLDTGATPLVDVWNLTGNGTRI
jgi:UDP-N-acetyl-D-mannosaminuronic acid dehydrogenase